MKFFGIVLISVICAALYGVAHDLVTVHICPEYFTVAHAPVFKTDSLVLLAVAWGSVTSSLLGIPMGFIFASASQNGRKLPSMPVAEVLPYLGRLVSVVAISSLFSGILGFVLFRLGALSAPHGFSEIVAVEKHVLFFAVQWAHGGAYLAGIVGTGVVALWMFRARKNICSIRS